MDGAGMANAELEAGRLAARERAQARDPNGLLVTGLCVMIGIAFAHLDNRRNCRIALALFATGMAASIFIIAAHSRPFNSTVSPQLLDEIKAQYFIY